MRSVFGSSAAMCVDLGHEPSIDKIRRTAPGRQAVLRAPEAGDGVPATMCGRCQFRGPHPSAVDCTTALRDRIAVHGFMAKGLGRGRRKSGN